MLTKRDGIGNDCKHCNAVQIDGMGTDILSDITVLNWRYLADITHLIAVD